MPCPDPFDRVDYLLYISTRSPWRMSVAECEREALWIVEWLQAHEFVGRAPRPGALLRRTGYVIQFIGIVATFGGIVGFAVPVIGTVATIAGLGVFILGRGLKFLGDAQLALVHETLELVQSRLAGLMAEISRRRA
jgi:hypothetical protein